VMLVAFCSMMGVKSLHHHHHDCCCECEGHHTFICVLDGEDLCHCEHHDHDSFLPEWKAEEDDCAICQFQIVKVISPGMSVELSPVTIQPVLYCAGVPSILSAAVFYHGSRAPPIG